MCIISWKAKDHKPLVFSAAGRAACYSLACTATHQCSRLRARSSPPGCRRTRRSRRTCKKSPNVTPAGQKVGARGKRPPSNASLAWIIHCKMAIIKGLSLECIRFGRIFRPADQMECKFTSYLIAAESKTCVRSEVRLELTRSLGDKAGSAGIITLKSNQYSNWVEIGLVHPRFTPK
jgi:hypothetical protein